MSCAMTAATSAVATARTQAKAGVPSSSRPAASTPSERQISVGTMPASRMKA